ncbi:hypothetical protein [Rubinisphaera margarita]|uniref:hypothetical protein n=1 Tax=Rubinisphaera margarita TaxID=2909586 RepID=UPI001EE93A52|nr:hypothetical protein [Rubinisphaera margarita]MCG6154923.1 hypothetical protein [Rubinisphaera margarita]
MKEANEARAVAAEQDTTRCKGLRIRSVDAGRDFLALHLENGRTFRIYCDGDWVRWEIADGVAPIGFRDEESWEIEFELNDRVIRYGFPRKMLVDGLPGRSVRMITVLGKCLFLALDSFQYMFDSCLDMADNTYVFLYNEENE